MKTAVSVQRTVIPVTETRYPVRFEAAIAMCQRYSGSWSVARGEFLVFRLNKQWHFQVWFHDYRYINL